MRGSFLGDRFDNRLLGRRLLGRLVVVWNPRLVISLNDACTKKGTSPSGTRAVPAAQFPTACCVRSQWKKAKPGVCDIISTMPSLVE